MAKETKSNNLLLQLLPAPVAEAIISASERVYMDLRDQMIVPGEPIKSVDFPERGVISVLQPVDGALVEVTTIGREGIVGVSVALGVRRTDCVASCQVEGSVLRMSVEQFEKLIDRHPEFRRVCHKYVVAHFDQLSRNTACNLLHPVEQRCARWLLLTHDRCNREQFFLTQEFLAKMLGVSRTGVNAAATMLARKGLISYVRGRVQVLDRKGLEAMSCECYFSMEKFYNETLGIAL